jgi:hypothetical protein
MSHALTSGPTPFEQLSEEEQIQYIETHLDEIVAELRADKSIPSWHVDILADRLARVRSESEGGIPWEEFEKEFMKD